MEIDLDQRRATLSVGEFSDFALGPRSSDGGASGLWRAQLGTQWHQDLRQAAARHRPDARFEVTIAGELFHRGWRLRLQGRIDQLWPGEEILLREIKTITLPLPATEEDLRRDYPSYFLQLAAYRRLAEQDPACLGEGLLASRIRGELVFVEIATGLLQTVPQGAADETAVESQLALLVAFLEQRWQSRERLRRLRITPPFEQWRDAQQAGADALRETWEKRPRVCFEAPTGFGKTGVVLQAALERLQRGDAERLIYLSAKATGQWQVMATLNTMTSQGEESIAAWQVRPKTEHCIHTEFRCHPQICPHLRDAETRWPRSGLSRFYTLPRHPRSIDVLRAAGREVSLCPYEITRAALPFCEVWVGDMNYVFASSIRGLFFDQPGFDATRTLLVVDEAHHLPSRAADALSHSLRHADVGEVLGALHRLRAPQRLLQAWDAWAHALKGIEASDALSLADEDDLRDALRTLAQRLTEGQVDTTALPTEVLDAYWQPARVHQDLQDHPDVPRLWTSPRARCLDILCLDAASVIGPLLRSFAGVVLTSATFGPEDAYARSVGLDQAAPEAARERPASPEARLGKLTLRETRKLFKGIQFGTTLLRAAEAESAARPAWVRAGAPWRAGTYDVAIDVRVDTRYQQRQRDLPVTAATIGSLVAATPSDRRCVAVFFSSYAYAEAVREELHKGQGSLRVALQPRAQEKTDTAQWIESVLPQHDALFLVLGSSLAESVDILGGRIALALVVGPALPEVNAVQRAKMDLYGTTGRDEGFRTVYQIPGMQRVNQALGRLVRTPGHRTRVVLQCQRFADAAYRNLLGEEYQQQQTVVRSDADLREWLALGALPSAKPSGSGAPDARHRPYTP